ncbi:hypothetical protein BDI4_630104 [Burkholderia diffusa]|nr:hypothetical protein BDI4_630104 [Burkholderia diffusa]
MRSRRSRSSPGFSMRRPPSRFVPDSVSNRPPYVDGLVSRLSRPADGRFHTFRNAETEPFQTPLSLFPRGFRPLERRF